MDVIQPPWNGDEENRNPYQEFRRIGVGYFPSECGPESVDLVSFRDRL